MNDLDFIVGLMKQGYNREPNELGFIPDTKISEYYLAQGLYIIQRDHRGHSRGYLLHGKPRAGQLLTVAQAIVDLDYRDAGHGRGEVTELIERARIANCRAIKVRCAADLESNLFWRAVGFIHTATEYPDNKRQRAINIYVFDLWPRLTGT